MARAPFINASGIGGVWALPGLSANQFGTISANQPAIASTAALLLTGNSTGGGVVAQISNVAATSAYVEFGGNGNAVGGANTAYVGQDSSGLLALNNRNAAGAYIATSGTQRLVVSAAGAVTINAPTSGTALTVGGNVVCTSSANVNNAIYSTTNTGASSFSLFTESGASGVSLTFYNTAYASGSTFNVGPAGATINNSSGTLSIGTSASASFNIFTNNVSRISVTSSGLVSISGSVGINGASGASALSGWGTPSGAVVVSNYNGATATLVQTSNAVAAIINQLINFGLFKS